MENYKIFTASTTPLEIPNVCMELGEIFIPYAAEVYGMGGSATLAAESRSQAVLNKIGYQLLKSFNGIPNEAVS